MLDLFRIEAENQTALLTSTLLELERGVASAQQLETLMRAAHSLKGAARIVNLQPVVTVAHAMEDSFVSAQQGKLQIRQREIDVLLRGVDLLLKLSKSTDGAGDNEISEFLTDLAGIAAGAAKAHAPPAPATTAPAPVPAIQPSAPAETQKPALRPQEHPERVVRLAAENLNRLLGLAGESLVESRWLRPFADSLQRLKRHHAELAQRLDFLRHALGQEELPERVESHIHQLSATVADCQQFLAARAEELDLFDRRSAHLSH